MTKFSILIAAAIPALMLGGCAGTKNRSVESVHQPVVSRSDYALDLATAPDGLAAGEDRRLAGWLDTLRLGYGDRIAVDDPSGEGVAARTDIAAVVGRYGLLLSGDAPVTTAQVTPGTIRVVVSRMRASVPGCPDWSRNSSQEFNSNTSSNYGCAVNSNLAAMIARPDDLVRGQANTEPNDPATSAKAIDSYRKATPTGANNAIKSEATGNK